MALAGYWGPEALFWSTSGIPARLTGVAVYLPDTNTLATLYTDETKVIQDTNPALTDVRGNLSFFADPGKYQIQMVGSTDRLDVVVDAHPDDPDAPHGHAQADVTGLVAALGNKSDTGHVHTIANVTGLQVSLDGKAPTTHGHVIADTTGLQVALDGKQATGDYATNTALTDGLVTKANVVHTHAVADTTGLQAALDGKQATGDYATNTALTDGLAGKQALDSDLTTIAGLTVVNDSLLQGKSGAWAVRTPAQVKTDLALTKSDVGLANADNTSDANKPVSTATQTALNAKVAKGELLVSVKDHGAVGDGVANDQPAIGTALAAVSAGGTLFFPPGTYLLNTRIIVSKSVILRGAGPEASKLSIVGAAFEAQASNVQVRDLTVIGAAGARNKLAMQNRTVITDRTNWVFEGVKFDGVGLNISRIGAIDSVGVVVTSATDLANRVEVINCEFLNYTEDGTVLIRGTNNVTVERCWIHNNGTDINKGDAIKVAYSSTGVKLIHNLMEDSARDGIDTYNAKELTIIGNVIKDPGVHGIETKYDSNFSLNDKNIVMGNRVFGAGRSTLAPSMQLSANHLIIMGNWIQGGSSTGYRTGPANNDVNIPTNYVLYQGNQVNGCSGDGFLITGTVNCIIMGNIASSVGGSGYRIPAATNAGTVISGNIGSLDQT